MGEDVDEAIRTYDRMTELREELDDVERQREGAHRKYYEWPTTRSLLPDIDGKRVLDAGCGNGDFAEWMTDRGADVVGLDRSEKSIEFAREHVDDVEFRCGDLGEPLDFAEADSFDIVLSQLALDHLEDWEPVFAEFARVLRPGGLVVCSVGNPVFDFLDDDANTYYELERIELPWGGLGSYDFRRPFSEVIRPILASGFRLEELEEPRPQPEFEEAAPDDYELHERVPRYLCLRTRLTDTSAGQR